MISHKCEIKSYELSYIPIIALTLRHTSDNSTKLINELTRKRFAKIYLQRTRARGTIIIKQAYGKHKGLKHVKRKKATLPHNRCVACCM